MICRSRNWLYPCLLSLLLVIPAHAQDDLEEELFFAPAETVTAATRRPLPLAESPSAVTVLTREDIEAAGAHNVPEALRLVPGMDVYQLKPIWYGLGIRGLGSQNADNVLLLVDGRDTTLEFFGDSFWAFQQFSMEEVERIEVVRGPGSALYGANAYSGVVHVITRQPGEGPRLAFTVRGAEHGRSELHARGTGTLGPVSLSAAAGLELADLWTARDTSAEDGLRARLAGKVDLGEETDLYVDVGLLTGTGAFHTVADSTIHDGYGIYTLGRFHWQDLTLQLSFDRNDFEADFPLELYYEPLGIELARIPTAVARVDRLNSSGLHTVEIAHNRITYGVEHVLNLYHSEQFVEPDQTEHRVGLFAQDEVDLGALLGDLPPLHLTVGLRFDWNSMSSWELSPRAALVFSPWPGHVFRAGYAHAFMKPTFFAHSLSIHLDDINHTGIDRLDAANPDLENETIDSLEAGYQGSFLDGDLLVQVDLAFNWYRDSPVFRVDMDKLDYRQVGSVRVPVLGGEGFRYVNDPEGADGHNLELMVTWRPTRRSRLYAQAAYRQLFNAATRRFVRTEPVWRLGAGGDLQGTSGWSLAVRAYFTAAHDSLANSVGGILQDGLVDRIPGILLINARLAWRLKINSAAATIGLEIHNLLDDRAREYAGVSRPNQPDYAGERMGRLVSLFLRGEFE